MHSTDIQPETQLLAKECNIDYDFKEYLQVKPHLVSFTLPKVYSCFMLFQAVWADRTHTSHDYQQLSLPLHFSPACSIQARCGQVKNSGFSHCWKDNQWK